MPKNPEYEDAKLRLNMEDAKERLALISREIDLTYVHRIVSLTEMVRRWMNYVGATSEDYAAEYKDVDPEDEQKHLVTMSNKLLETKYDETRNYIKALRGIYAMVRSKVLRKKVGDDLQHFVAMTEAESKSLYEKLEAISDLEKKLPDIDFTPPGR